MLDSYKSTVLMFITVITHREKTMIATRKDKGVLVRLKEPVIKRLDVAAAKQGRSRNTEINIRLAESLGIKKKSTT